MNQVQQQFKRRKKAYYALLVTLFGIIIVLGIISPHGKHEATSIELIMFGGLIGIVIAMYAVLRCPKCGKTLVPAASTFWRKLRYCPSCGVELVEE